jgi:small subunit ribosomal protein S3
LSAVNHFIKKGIRQTEIDEYLGSELGRAGYGGVDIAKTPLGERITIHAARPGIVIGRRGKNIRMITDELVSRFGLDNPQIEVKEVVKPELNAKVMAYSLVSAIERGVHRRRAAYSVLRRVVNSGAKGCEIIISGKLTSKRSRHEAYRMGLVAKSGELGSEYVMRANTTAVMKLGTIGVTVSIMRGDVILPDEITIQAYKFEEDVIEEEVAPAKPAEKKSTKPEEKETKKAEKPTKKVEPKKAPTAKKTELDKEVEKLSDLIEKSPPKEKAAAKKTPAKKKTTTTKKEPTKKTTEKVEPAKPAAKKKTTTAKKEPAKKKTTTTKEPAKKKTTTKKTTTKKADTKKTPAKKTTTKKTSTKKEPAKKKTATKKAADKKTKADKDKKKKK